MAGFEKSSGDVVVTLDGDLQNPPEEIPRLLEKAEEGYDVVGTVRINRCDTLFRRISSRIINSGVRRSTGVSMRDYGCMLRAYQRHIVDAMRPVHLHTGTAEHLRPANRREYRRRVYLSG